MSAAVSVSGAGTLGEAGSSGSGAISGHDGYGAFLASKRRRVTDVDTSAALPGWSWDEWGVQFGHTPGDHYIYGLVDPRDRQLRYVGKSDNPHARVAQHLREDRGTHRCNWVQSVKSSGLRPLLRVLDSTPAGSDWPAVEKAYIAACRDLEARLTNGTDGGEGVTGLAPATRRRLSDAARGRRHSAETRARMSAAKKGRPQTEEWKATMRARCAGRPLSSECIETIRARMQKLCREQVLEIKAALAAGESQTSIALRYPVTNGTISNISRGRTYGDVQ